MNSTNPYLFHVGRVDEAKFSVPSGYEQCRGYTRQSLVDRTVGSVHMGVSVGQLAPDGEIARCVNAPPVMNTKRCASAGWCARA